VDYFFYTPCIYNDVFLFDIANQHAWIYRNRLKCYYNCSICLKKKHKGNNKKIKVIYKLI
jgi:hypothetical protein